MQSPWTLIDLLHEAATEIRNLSDDENPVARRAVEVARELEEEIEREAVK